MIPEKRAPLGVAAVAAATRRVPGLRGAFFGDGPERDAVLVAIGELGGQQSIEAPGFVPAERVESELRRAMCMLLPSSREGYGLIVIEAAARATPSVVVAGEDNAAVELIEEGINGFVAASADPESIAEAIARVHKAGFALRESTARWFAQNASRLSLESSLQQVLESYARARA
jgi:glycosyltransferase involved in cell wall biosynthesis